MSTSIIILIIVVAAAAVSIYILYRFGKKQQQKSAEMDRQVEATARPYNILVIDKKKMKITQAGLPESVVNSTPRFARLSKVPIVKAKIGPKVVTLICDNKIFPLIPVKKECKAWISGLYISDVKGIRETLRAPEKKKGKFSQAMKKLR